MSHRAQLAAQQFDLARQTMLQALRWLPPELRAMEIQATISVLKQLEALEK